MQKNKQKQEKTAPKTIDIEKGSQEEKVLSFNGLGISDSILKVLSGLNLEEPTPIQYKTIPVALEGQDLIGIAQTGTGKTYAFGIPMLQNIGLSKSQGLVIAPTRELAIQVAESLKKLGTSLGLRVAILIGGEAIDRQLYQLRKGPHIVIATPGRLIDHLKRRTYKADRVSVLVLDEADMMLDLGFAPQIKEILQSVPSKHQTMLFSATMPEAITKMAAKYMKFPISIEVAKPGTTAAQIDQEMFIIRGEKRLEHLQKLLASHDGSVLVFARTKHGVKTLTMKLQMAGYSATEIHSNLSLGRRKSSLESFKSKKTRIMVATDVAARGLDINNIELVVNYNLPDSSEDYVHRIGRTARAGKKGKAISFATTSQFREIKKIEALIGQSIKTTEFTTGAKFSPSDKRGSQPSKNRSFYKGDSPSRERRKRYKASRGARNKSGDDFIFKSEAKESYRSRKNSSPASPSGAKYKGKRNKSRFSKNK